VTPEAGLFLEKARRCLSHADAILKIDLGNEAGRAAYLTAFHAPQALIHERTDREAKTHQGVRSQFLRLTKDDPRIPVELRRFPSQAYDLKSVADYATGPDAIVPLEQAAKAIGTAHRFLDCVTSLLDAA
jgi:uncharacterized protein (UPF0332 family)